MKTFIAIPCFDKTDAEFESCLDNLELVGSCSKNRVTSSLIYDARDKLAQQALDAGADYILWFDSDMIFNSDLLINMMKDIESGMDFVTGLYFARRPDYEPCVWTKIRLGIGDEAICERLTEIPEEPFPIDACGFGCVLMKSEVAYEVIKANRAAFAPMYGYGEDISFCIRARKLGFKLFCDPRLKIGHIARTVVTEETYKAWKERKQSNGIIG